MKKLILILLLLIPMIIAEDLRVTLLTPSATFYKNDGDIINYYVGVKNKNNFSIDILINGENLTFKDSTNFSLQPNEIKYVNFSYIVNKNETLTIPIRFSHEQQQYSLAETIIIRLVNVSSHVSNNVSNITYEVKKRTNSDNTPNNTKVYSNVENNSVITSDDSTNISSEPTNNYMIFFIIGGVLIIVILLIIEYYIIKYVKGGKEKNEKTIDSFGNDGDDTSNDNGNRTSDAG